MSLFDFFRRKKKIPAAAASLKDIWYGFQRVLAVNNEILLLMGELEEKHSSQEGFNLPYVRAHLKRLDLQVANMVAALSQMSGNRWPDLENTRQRMQKALHQQLEARPKLPACPPLLRLEEAGEEHLAALGGKSAHLVLVKNNSSLPVPEGFAISLTAYQMFLDHKAQGETASLREKLHRRLDAWESWDAAALEQAAPELQALVVQHPLPEKLASMLVAESEKLAATPEMRLVVRSSGCREDLSASLAGLFESFLAVTPQEVPDHWRQVVASQFGAPVLAYMKAQGLRIDEVGMGVLIQRMVEARAAGVMFTSEPGGDAPDCLVISASWGLAGDLVQDRAEGDEFLVAKEDGHLVQFRAGRKEQRLVLADGHITREMVAPELVSVPALEPDDLKQLAAFAQALENFFLAPQDVEWAKDKQGQIHIIQSRPLKTTMSDFRRSLEISRAAANADLLLNDCRVASPGVAAGPVFRLADAAHLEKVPAGVVLVVPRTSPQLAPVLGRIAALVTKVGSATGHLALLAREVGVPMLVDSRQASEQLTEGQTVTVDAYHGKVYGGALEEVLRFQRRPTRSLIPDPVSEQLRAVVRMVIPLTLIDPRHPDFRPELIRTYHDLAFFCNNKAIEAMFGLIDSIEAGRLPSLRLLKLDTTLPLNLHLIDLGEGLASYETPVPPKVILSVPMKALWKGITHPDITWAGPVPVSVSGFLHVLGQSAIRPPERFWDKTYAIVAPNYVNYACRLGYHFSGVDSYCSDTADSNYINFAFKGGAADETRRIRRVNFIAMVLDQLGFEVEVHLDVIRARLRKRPLPETEEKLEILGRLMAYVRQMDMLMSSDSMVTLFAERFLAGHYERPQAEELSGEPQN